jgi:zinc protease
MSTAFRTEPPAPGEIRPFSFPRIAHEQLPNGLTLLSAAHGTLPIVTVQLVFGVGGASDPSGKDGLAYLVAAGLDTGTTSRDGEQLAWELERLGVELVTSASWDAIVVETTTPASRLEPTLTLLADVVQNAVFPDNEIARVRNEQLAEIMQHSKEPRALADEMSARFTFAPNLRYARPLLGTEVTVRSLARADVAAFHRERFTPASAALIIAGDIDQARARKLAETSFGTWTGGAVGPAAFDVQPRTNTTTIFVVDRPEAVQSELRIGHTTVPRNHPDYVPLQVMNTMLGGAFTSRLNLNLRERHGYTYGVRSSFGHRRVGGRFVVATAVGTEVTAPATEQILLELERLRAEGAQDDEVANARDYLAGITPLQLQTAEQVANRMAELFVYDLPDDWFNRYRADIARVTTAEIARVAAEHIQTQRLAVVVVGNAAEITPSLRELNRGPVETQSAHQP